MVPTARALGALVLGTVLLFYAATSEVSWLWLLATWLDALFGATFVYAVWNRRGVTVSISVRESRPAGGSPAEDLPDGVLRRSPSPAPVFEGDGMGIEIAFRARSGPRGPVWAYGNVGGRRFAAAAAVVTRQGSSRMRWAQSARRGVLNADGWHVGTSDPLGFFRGFRKLPDAELGLILPTFTSLSARTEVRELEASLAAPRAGSGNELFGIREYRPGDSLRRIHWRSSARHGELVVREYEPPGVQTLVILVDPQPPRRETADQIARIAASEAWDCLRDGGRVALAGSLETRDIWEVLEWLARYPDGSVDAPESPDIVVTADPHLLAPRARRNWLVGDEPANGGAVYQRVGTSWPI